MNIGLIGYGKMGRLIHSIAENRGHTVTLIIDPQAPEATAKALSELTTRPDPTFPQEGKESQMPEVLIDFSHPDGVVHNIETACRLGFKVVVGTTGWNDELPRINKLVQESGNALIWASNFSPAVQMFFRIVRRAAAIANALPECDIATWEAHHRHKADAPSGTALSAANILLDEIDRKSELLLDRPQGKIREDQLHLATIRAGEIPGTHSVLFDFPAETIEIKSVSRSRDGFALGAVMAAEWLADKKGFFHYDEVFEEML